LTTDKYIYLLLRLALHYREADIQHTLQIDWTAVDWPQLYDTAKAQGVSAIVFDGISAIIDRYPEVNVSMPRHLKLRWLSIVDSVEKKYAKQERIARKLADICNDAGIDTVLFKGLGLSRLYPIPNHRECGDIDIYACNGEAQRLDDAIVASGAKIKHISQKHTELFVNGITIESHRLFIKRYFSKDAVEMNQYLIDSLSGSKPYFEESRLKVAGVKFNSLFVLYHAANHFKFEGISLRHIIDWCFVVQNANGEIADVARMGLADFSAVLCRIGNECLGFDLPHELCCSEDDVYNRVLADIVNSNIGKDEEKVSLFTVLRRKYRRFTSRRWAYSLVNDSYIRGLGHTILAHIVEPMAIFRGNK